ncbi:MAG: polysaccharide deacetylase family protein [Acidimicrobiales bacterium]
MRPGRHPGGFLRGGLGQLLAGLVAIPLSAVPFVGYASLTPEGRLVRDRAMVALFPPSLPQLAAHVAKAAASAVPRYTGQVMSLAYHGIGSGSDGEGGFVVSPSRFGEHLATLKAAGMHAVTARQVAEAFEGGRPLPAKAVLLSFDDGRTDAMMFADPLLQQAGMAATMFVITGAAEDPGIYYASWDKLAGYAKSGRWDLQSHTAALHREQEAAGGGKLPALTSLAPGESLAEFRARIRADLSEATGAITSRTGRRPVAFAYPFGAYGAERTNDPRIQAVLREEVGRRYAIAFHQDEQDRVPLAGPDDESLGIRRLEVGNWSGLQLLQRIAGAVRRSVPPPAPDDVLGAPAPDPMAPGLLPPPLTTAPPPSTTTTAPGRPAGTTPATAPPSRSTTSRPPSTTTPTTSAPTTTTTTVPPATTTTRPPTTTPTTTTTTTRPPTTTTIPPTTTTTTQPKGCRSRGQGNICGPGQT